MGSTWHEKYGWRAADYFDDPKVVALCHAIEADDVAEIDRLILAGANVNARGKENMTPLLWAFPDNKLKRFVHLLECGADPNVVVQSDLNTHGHLGKGQSVTHLACMTVFHGYFEAVFAHGGDPNLVRNGRISGQTPLFSVLAGNGPDKRAHVKLLIEKGADLNRMDGGWSTPVMEAVSWTGQFDLALMMLEAGADFRVCVPKSNTRLVHIVAMQEDRRSTWSPQQAGDYQKLVSWLENHGESLENARADISRWQSWIVSTGEYRRNLDAEIAEREAREARQKTAVEGTDPKK
jgi:ankyrin repeat protein